MARSLEGGESPARRKRGAMSWIIEGIEGWQFPAFMLFTLAFATSLLALMLIVPTKGTALESFANDFRIWCFGLEPETGRMQWAYVVGTLTSPILLGAFTCAIWAVPLRAVLKFAPRKLIKPAAAALTVVAILVGVFASFDEARAASSDLRAFPARELRTSIPAPPFELVNQDGQTVSLESLRGHVAIVTGVYSRCGTACPMILAQARRVLAALTPEERADLVVVAITLDPARDDVPRLHELASGLRARTPTFQFATGEQEIVEHTLDRFDISRRRDPATGEIDHARMFIVVDRNARIAYRFSVGSQQEAWLTTAVRLLLAEPVPRA